MASSLRRETGAGLDARMKIVSQAQPGRDPAFVKLDLFCRGLRLEREPGAEEGRPIERTRAGLGSGLELVLPGGLWVNAPVRERFAERSPYSLEQLPDGSLALRCDGEIVMPVALPPPPAWYDRVASSGRPLRRVGTMQATYLAIYQGGVCAHWTGDPPGRNCKFCSVGLNVPAGEDPTLTTAEITEVCRAARDESGITYVDFNTGHLDGEGFLDLLEPAIRRIKKELGLMVGVQAPPHRDLRRYDALRRMGVNRVSFCIELFDRERFREVCPGKGDVYGYDRYLEAIRYSASLGRVGPRGEPWVTNGEIIAGLEPPDESIRAIDWITAVGAIPTVCVFRPLVGTALADREPPRAEDLVPVFRRLYEACMERGLPIGCAPGIRVGLVLLPEECRSFSAQSYRWQRLKLGALRALATGDRRLRMMCASSPAS